MSELHTSCVEVISATHCRQRELERTIRKIDLQTAIKYGKAELQVNTNPHTSWIRRWKFTYNRIVFITEYDRKTAVTTWALDQLPIEAAPLSRIEQSQIQEQKRRISSGTTPITSHTVFIIDQSGSMKKSDVTGHRSRSRAVFYTIANEMIAIPLLHNMMNFTDTVSLIEMRDTAEVPSGLENVPFSWDLHNQIVGLAKEPMRPAGQGNYLPALEKAHKLLRKYDNGSCALFLLFLSDGGPSDFSGTSAYHSSGTCVINKSIRICKEFSDRLTFGSFGFAYDAGSTFNLLRDMTNAATAAGSKGVFSSGLDTDTLRRSLNVMTTSLISTRTALSTLAGGSILRVDPASATKVKRTDLIRDSECNDAEFDPNIFDWDFFWKESDGLKIYNATGQVGKNVCIDFHEVPFKHPDAKGIAMAKAYIDKGAERATYKMTEVDRAGNRCGQALVAKVSINEEPDQFEFHKGCGKTQMTAAILADKFNSKMVEMEIRVPRIEFLRCSFYEWGNGYRVAVLAEKYIPHQRYTKYNDNKGGVNTVNKAPLPLGLKDQGESVLKSTVDMMMIGDIEEGDEESDSDDDSDERDVVDCRHIIDEDVPQAFSHWSYQYTKGYELVCDLQGVKGSSSFELTDPAIHSRKQQFGPTDRSLQGMNQFFSTHVCNPLCEALRLRMPEKRKERYFHNK